MSKIIKLVKNNRLVFTTFFSTLILILLASVLSFGATQNTLATFVNPFNHWIKENHTLLMICHIFLLIAITMSFEIKINHLARQKNVPPERIRSLKKLGWIAIGIVMLIDFLVFI